jgi:hypothetical protein
MQQHSTAPAFDPHRRFLVQRLVAPLVGEEKSRSRQPGELPAAAKICHQRMGAADGMSGGATAVDGGKGLRQALD